MANETVTVEWFKNRREVLAFCLLNPSNQPLNLTGYTGEADIRKEIGGTELRNLNAFITCTDGTTQFEGFAYNVLVDIPAAETNQWTFGEAYTDVLVKEPGGAVYEYVRYFLKKIGSYTE